MKYCIDQPGSLGDILFSIKIAEELAKKGEVYWYIAPCFWESGVSRIKVSIMFILVQIFRGMSLEQKPLS